MSKAFYNTLNEIYETERADAIAALSNITRRCRSDMGAYMLEPGCLEKQGIKMIEAYIPAQKLLLQLMREEMQDAQFSDMTLDGAQDFESEVHDHE